MKSALKKVSLILAICFVAFHLYTAAFGTMPGIAQKSIHLGFLLVIFYINAMIDSEKRWEQIFLGIMALFALGGCAYITILDENLQLRAGIVYASDILFAILLIIAIFEACPPEDGQSPGHHHPGLCGLRLPGQVYSRLPQPARHDAEEVHLFGLSDHRPVSSAPPSMPRPPMWSCSSCWALS